jgi:hypothetical protein
MSIAIGAILCADWAKEADKRAVYLAEVESRSVRRLSSPKWTFDSVIAMAESLGTKGGVLVGFDVPLGVPASYLASAQRMRPAVNSFPTLLTATIPAQEFFEATTNPADWCIQRPFFAVPPVKGGLTSYVQAAERQGGGCGGFSGFLLFAFAARAQLRGLDGRATAAQSRSRETLLGYRACGAGAEWTETAPIGRTPSRSSGDQ